MRKKAFKLISALLCALFLSAALSAAAGALTYGGSESYKSGKYYKQLCEVELTGDLRADIVNVAKSQVGYLEGSNSSQLAGTYNGSNNFTEYGRWYGLQDMWCAMFVSFCAYVANVPESVILKHAYTPTGLSWFQSKGQAYSRASVAKGEYTPEPGDIIYFKSSRNSNPTNHIGIVTKYSNKRVYTIEGNTSSASVSTNGGAVGSKSYSITDTYIVYICRPDYEVGAANNDIKSTNDEYKAVPGGVKIRGWCYDKNDTGTSLYVHVYFGSADKARADINTLTTADKSRPDVNSAFGCGNNHGYDATVYTKLTGKQPVYVFAVNPKTNERNLITSFTVTIPESANIKSTLEGYEASPGGVKIKGWCYDTTDKNSPLQIQVYFDGAAGEAGVEINAETTADAERADVDGTEKCGEHHGFDNTVYTLKRGEHEAAVYAVNPNTNEGKQISRFTVVIPDSTLTPGDVNRDGAINNKDIVELFRYVSQSQKSGDEAAHDFNADEEVNNKDVAALFRYVSSD